MSIESDTVRKAFEWAKRSRGNMKVLEPEEQVIRHCLPCSRCGEKERTASFYLQADSDKKIMKGFYSDLSIRLCVKCLKEALKALGE